MRMNEYSYEYPRTTLVLIFCTRTSLRSLILKYEVQSPVWDWMCLGVFVPGMRGFVFLCRHAVHIIGTFDGQISNEIRKCPEQRLQTVNEIVSVRVLAILLMEMF
eukprot:scaffold41833_cov46-Prasinocladus_malaysianus.AAC.1